MAFGSRILDSIVNLVLPERCPCCGTITSAGGPFCAECWQKLHFLNPPWCSSCAAPFSFDRGDDAVCASCLDRPPLHDGIRAVVKYDDLSAQVVLRLKYSGKVGVAKMIAKQLARHLPDDRTGIIVTPVPLHWTRMWSRSFNQSALIGAELGRIGGLDYIPDLLVRQRRTPSMRGMSAKERRKAVGKAFAVHPRWESSFAGRQVILVDDVLTTGATSDGCIKALKKDGAMSVQLFCWARALRGEAAESGEIAMLDA
jgi:ComF family protein